MRILPFLGVLVLLSVSTVSAKPTEMYLYYNSHSPSLYEIDIKEKEVAKVFDDIFGPATEELPMQVQYADFYVSRYPDDGYVFILNAPYSCGRLGCATEVYRRDADGDLQPADENVKPVKCKVHADDKLICINGGYKPEMPKRPKPKGPIHYPAPRQ
ncbi:MAG: hypothetical protein IJW72_06480 [Alphaproteobacteria bacterium]|nr:hypothetical protein [Alphaproteobacteria bacterium]MBQ7285877.1 hypothetical protein [Alphaproteobacteria bacterium]